ncbi:MAG: nucleotidyltransferase domain-containing protein [Spirochaetota bacterium]
MNQSNIHKYLISLDFIQTAIVFGSQVNGKTKTYAMSDIDIAILSQKEIPLLQSGGIISNLETICEQKVDLAVLNGLYYKDPQFAFNIIDNHREIFVRDRDVWNQYK